jgi:hypothetical protein
MHVVAKVGFWDSPRTLAFAARVRNPDAGGWVLRLYEFILTFGTDDGRLPGFSAEEIAAKVRPTCSHRVFFDALKAANFLKRRRRTFYDPEWKQSPMGRYCELRKEDRLYQKELRVARREARLAEIRGEDGGEASVGRRSDVAKTSERGSVVRKDGRPPDVPSGPPGAPRRGGRDGAARWEWFAQNHLKISAPDKCQRLLEQLTPDEWEHLQFSLPQQMARFRGGRERKFCPGAVKYLAEKRFLEIRRPSPQEHKAAALAQKSKHKPNPELTPDAAKKASLKYIVDLMADRDVPAEKIEKQKKIFFDSWGEKPWETPAPTAPDKKPHKKK